MQEGREDREGGWRIAAPLIGSITISRKALLRILAVGVLLFTACEWWEAPRRGLYQSSEEKAALLRGTPLAEPTVRPDDPVFFPQASPDVKLYQEPPPVGDPIEVFRVDNLLAVYNGGTPTSFTMQKDHWVTEVGTYHYNDGKGREAGTIALKASDGTTYGPWQAALDQGWYWRAKPNMWIPAGSYTVIDSDPSTHSQNSATGGQGIAWMFGKQAP